MGDKKESVIETTVARSAAELATLLTDPEVINNLNKSSDDLFKLDDPAVELNREMVKMGLAVDEYIDLLPQVTNLDHPAHAKGLSHDITELELMRLMGLPLDIYTTYLGRGKPLSGFFGMLKARMGIIYPGFGIDIHPRGQLFGGLSKNDKKKDQSLRQRISAYFQ